MEIEDASSKLRRKCQGNYAATADVGGGLLMRSAMIMQVFWLIARYNSIDTQIG
jgi:hypothetical protein